MESLFLWLAGQLSDEARIWTALAPAVAMSAYFIMGLGVYAARVWLRGHRRDGEIEARHTPVLTGLWIRLYFAWLMQPLWRLVLRTGVPPAALTTLSLLLAAGSGVALAAGRFALGGWLYIFAGIFDFLDGRLARAQGSSTTQGAALDSILDRYSDAAVLVGLAWFYRNDWVLLPVLMAMMGSSLIPYIRAKGEALGLEVTVGIMQRAERIVYLGVAVALSPILEVLLNPLDPRPIHRLAVVGIVLLAVSTQLTAAQRLVFLLRALAVRKAPRRGRVFSKNLVAAAVATGADFVVVALCSELGWFTPPAATAVGCGLGAMVNFGLNRVWTFGSRDARLPQMSRYVFVSSISAMLNAGGVAVLLLLPGFDFRIGWWLVRGAVFLAWNFPLHRDYVFAASPLTVSPTASPLG